MKTFKIISIVSSIMLIIFLVLYYGFNLRYWTGFGYGQIGDCKSVKDSKFIRVFICEYKPEKNDIFIDDKIRFTIKESWVEEIWTYTNDFRKPDTNFVCEADCSFIIITKKNDLQYHGILWKLDRIAAPSYEQNYGNLLSGGMKYDELKDTLHIKILKKNPNTGEFTDSIGVVRFFKVKE